MHNDCLGQEVVCGNGLKKGRVLASLNDPNSDQ